jgi:BirA family transcriptional regulator, biotin operon repressor / biotin---[acetyl-CoA-carboxylase] ligase
VPDEARYDGRTAAELAALLALPEVRVFDVVSTTMDVAHERAAAGASAGTLVVADAQTSGRGRGGTSWTSLPGQGLWLTVIERPNDARVLDVLALRLGLRAARALERFSASPVRLKWPNDLWTSEGKLAGIVAEARWRDGRPDWVAIGIGVNVKRPPGVTHAAGLADGTDRLEVLAELVPALRAASSARGWLTERELAEFGSRDLARDRDCVAPLAGRVDGITADGQLSVRVADGTLVSVRSGSLVLADRPRPAPSR